MSKHRRSMAAARAAEGRADRPARSPREARDCPRRSRVGRWTRRFAELGDQPPLVAISLGVIAACARRRARPVAAATGVPNADRAFAIGRSPSCAVKDRGRTRTRPGALEREELSRCRQGTSRDGRLRIDARRGTARGSSRLAGAIAADYPRASVPGAAALGSGRRRHNLPSRDHYLSDIIVGARRFAAAPLGVACARLAAVPRAAGSRRAAVRPRWMGRSRSRPTATSSLGPPVPRARLEAAGRPVESAGRRARRPCGRSGLGIDRQPMPIEAIADLCR